MKSGAVLLAEAAPFLNEQKVHPKGLVVKEKQNDRNINTKHQAKPV